MKDLFLRMRNCFATTTTLCTESSYVREMRVIPFLAGTTTQNACLVCGVDNSFTYLFNMLF